MVKKWFVSLALLCAGLIVSVAFAQEANAAPPGGWGPIVNCESGGQNIPNGGGSGATGYFQILDSTWASHGGRQFASRAMGASYAQQQTVAERVLADQGLGAWGPSQSCWGGKTGAVHLQGGATTHKSAQTAPVRHLAVQHTATHHQGHTATHHQGHRSHSQHHSKQHHSKQHHSKHHHSKHHHSRHHC